MNSTPLTLLAIAQLVLAIAPGRLLQAAPDAQAPRQMLPTVTRDASDAGKVNIQFPNAPVSDVLDIYERLINRPLVRDSQIYRGPNITLMPPESLTREEASRLIESALLLNGYLLIPGPEGSLKVVLNDPKTKQNPLREGIAIYTNPEQLPEGDGIAGYFLRLDFLAPDDAKALFETHVQLNTYGKITPIYAPPALLITENISLIKQILELKPLVDVDAALTQPPVKTELVEIKYADAAQVAEIVQALVDNRQPGLSTGAPAAKPQAKGSSQSKRAPQPAKPPQPKPQNRQVLNQDQLLTINAQLIPDERTNRILVVTEPANFDYILKLISDLDQPLELKPPLERPLRYVTAEDVLPVLTNILSETGDMPTQSIRPGGTLPSQLGARAGASNLARSTTRSSNSANRGGTFTGASGDTSAPPDQLTDPNDDTSPISVLIGKTRLIADRQANTILVVGPPESYDKVNTILDRLDRKPPQVYLATIIGQLTLGEDEELGIDYLLHFDKVNGGLLSADGLLNSVTDVSKSGLTKAVTPLGGLTVFGSISNNLDVLVRALESTNRFKILSRPTVYAANNKKAVITSGQQIPVPTNILTSLDANSSRFQTNIAYRDVVLKLEVVPLINSNKEVTLKIAQVNDTVTGQQIVSGNNVPIIGTERLNTTVSIPNAHTVVLGGLITEQLDHKTGGVPYLNRIPILGRAFKSSSTSTVRKELIIFIQPIVVSDEEELQATSTREDLRTRIGLDAAEVFPPPNQINAQSRPQPLVEKSKTRVKKDDLPVK